MEVTVPGTLLGRRLDRLKSGSIRPPSDGGRRLHDPAIALAEAVGGRVIRAESGSIVTIETSTPVAISLDRLARLPYGIDTQAPLVFVDLETTGLATAAGTLPFLVGAAIWQDGKLRMSQLLLPDHASERAMLDALQALLPTNGWLVTYNGKCFDWPLLTARYRLHRRDPPVLAGHLDLLPIARQLWKHRLGGARLALVEQELCGVERHDDLPGSLIPERYFTYLRSRQPDLLTPIVQHNQQDIVSMARLIAVLADSLADSGAWADAHPGDLHGLARGFVRRHRHDEALTVVEAALGARAWTLGVEGGAGLHRRLSAERAWLLSRLGRRDESYAAWTEIAARAGPGAGIAWLHVARYREHVLRDVAGALVACQQAGAVAERARAWGEPLYAVEADLARRLPRLRRLSFRRRPFRGAVGRAA